MKLDLLFFTQNDTGWWVGGRTIISIHVIKNLKAYKIGGLRQALKKV